MASSEAGGSSNQNSQSEGTKSSCGMGNVVQEMKEEFGKQMAEMNAKILELQQQVMMKESEEKGSCSVKNENDVEDEDEDEDDIEEVPRDKVVPFVKAPKAKSRRPHVREPMKLTATDIPMSLKMLHKYASVALFDGFTIKGSVDPLVFGHDLEVLIGFDDIHHMCELEALAASCICMYMWYLYKEYENSGILDTIRFVDPYDISHNPNVAQAKKASIVGQRLIGTKTDQLVLLPCNVGWHWVLMMVYPHKETVYVLDPLTDSFHVEEWKSIMTTAIKMFNMSIGVRGRQNLLWEVIDSPQQPDGKQCGFYVMRYMRDVIDNIVSDHSLPITTLFAGGCYSKKEIDEVRIEWAEFVCKITDE